MSRAFVREPEGGEAFEDLPDRPISTHSNLVTPAGLAAIERKIASLETRVKAAQESGDRPEVARASRDLRYWNHRRSSAEMVPDTTDHTQVRFGSTVIFRREDGRTQSYRIVGEDEADPPSGTISYVSPLAQALMGKAIGDVIDLGQGQAEIVMIA